MRHLAFVGLGSNMLDPCAQLNRAFADLHALPETCLLAQSALYRSAPVGHLDQPDFVNAVAKLATNLTPHDLLQALLNIEHQHGRERTFRNAPRTLDLDVLLYDQVRMHEHGLTLPHPQMHLRAFVLQPLLELASDVEIPGIGQVAQLILSCSDQRLTRIDDVV